MEISISISKLCVSSYIYISLSLSPSSAISGDQTYHTIPLYAHEILGFISLRYVDFNIDNIW